MTLRPVHCVLGVALLAVTTLSSCAPSPEPFDSNGWKGGDASRRGAMVSDLMRRGRLIGSSPAEVESVLGRPDHQGRQWFAYTVVTIPRCRVWQCRMDIVFDETSGRVKAVAVSD